MDVKILYDRRNHVSIGTIITSDAKLSVDDALDYLGLYKYEGFAGKTFVSYKNNLLVAVDDLEVKGADHYE